MRAVIQEGVHAKNKFHPLHNPVGCLYLVGLWRGITSEERELPLTDAEVPRVSLEEAKAALDSGAAILVDVRSPDAFEASHAVGAISVPLGEIERNITGLPLEKDQWIITYCT